MNDILEVRGSASGWQIRFVDGGSTLLTSYASAELVDWVDHLLVLKDRDYVFAVDQRGRVVCRIQLMSPGASVRVSGDRISIVTQQVAKVYDLDGYHIKTVWL